MIRARTFAYPLAAILCLIWLFACGEGPAADPAVTPVVTAESTALNETEFIIPPTSPVTPRPGEESDGDAQAAAPATATALPTNTPLPTATPQPADRLALGLRYLENGNFAAAIEQLSRALDQGLSDDQEQQIRYALGQAYLAVGQNEAAIEMLNQFLAASAGPQPSAPLGSRTLAHPAAAYALLAQAYQASGDGAAARTAYETYLLANPDMAFYIQSAIANSYEAAGELELAAAARTEALAAEAHKNEYVGVQYALAEYYLANGEYSLASEHYLAILDVAVTDTTRGDALYQAGLAEQLAGNTETAYALFERAFDEYPTAYTSYLGLVELVDAGIVVDEYQRGLVDFYAGAYQPALDAFDRYISAQTAVSATVDADVYRWQAYSFEGLGNVEAAIGALTAYGETDPAGANLEQAQLYFRNNQWEQSRLAYIQYSDTYTQTSVAAEATWWAARLTELFGTPDEAASRYLGLAERYPASPDAPKALFRAGFLLVNEGDETAALTAWETLMTNYPQSEFGAAARIWLVRSGLDEAALDGAEELAGFSYYHFRAEDLATGAQPFTPVRNLNLVTTATEQAEAENWLREQLGLAADTEIAALGPTLLGDARLVRGWKLWELGRWELARQELEAVRVAYNTDAVATYQLALFFRDIGLYRSSILAAANLFDLTGAGIFSAPRFLGALLYPIHYADLIVPLSARYGYDPLLQFALVRQESLYETFISSPVGAQGLSQVMPATGDYIAGQLGWPDYSTARLLDPYVGLNFGAFYLDQQLDGFDGSVHAALAAYNAGPGNAARWYEVAGDDIDLFVETIDFTETRLYVERIYLGHAIYRHLYGQ
ncbi:MAG: transglycosylase SLT domain-containing protein [Ardenticatenales bacterium]|nr:transglycosylase SLT domain-containing protein [Ardenticatenales bacterium]